jgi:hypothetical protein
MKGKKVQDWTHNQVKLLDDCVDRQGVLPEYEGLWSKFEKDFNRAFTDTTSKQDVYCMSS